MRKFDSMVYLVDDDTDDLELIQEALHRNHYTGPIATALNGLALMNALSKPKRILPRLILLDLNMPLKNGFEVLQEIKSDTDLKAIPVVVLTASRKAEDEKRCYALGCNLFQSKPDTIIEYNKLVVRIFGFLENR